MQLRAKLRRKCLGCNSLSFAGFPWPSYQGISARSRQNERLGSNQASQIPQIPWQPSDCKKNGNNGMRTHLRVQQTLCWSLSQTSKRRNITGSSRRNLQRILMARWTTSLGELNCKSPLAPSVALPLFIGWSFPVTTLSNNQRWRRYLLDTRYHLKKFYLVGLYTWFHRDLLSIKTAQPWWLGQILMNWRCSGRMTALNMRKMRRKTPKGRPLLAKPFGKNLRPLCLAKVPIAQSTTRSSQQMATFARVAS